MNRSIATLAGLFLAIVLVGCGLGGPSQTDVREILQTELDPAGEVVVVESIDNMNAAQQHDIWLVDVEATLRFPQSLTEVAEDMQKNGGAMESLSRLGLMLRFGQFEAGETRPYRTRLRLIDGKNGWMLAEPTTD